ncbi:MAG: DNA-binding response regulator [Deltaproteobacteria bacterium]|nr:MAG: DNA-binding response regulator [Deltaproteobacteria bacterium]
MKESILVVEDDSAIARGLEKNLRFEGYTVHVAGDGQRGLELAVDKQPDLILLDVMLPEMNGFAVLRELRRLELEMPVIMLTAKGEEMDKVRGLEMGADDYVTKPFGLAELLARIEAVLRRQRRLDRTGEQVCFGQVEIDFAARTVRVAGQPVELTSRELELLRFFLRQEGRVLGRQEILNRVWGFDYFGTDRTVDNFINRLRQKLEPDPAHPRHFITVRGAGYRFSEKGEK